MFRLSEDNQRIELQKEKEWGYLSEDFISGSMLPVGATITIKSDPENGESEHRSDEEFIFHPMLLQRYLEYLKDGLINSDQTDASEGNSSNIYNTGFVYDAFANSVSLRRAEKQNEYSLQCSEESGKLIEGKGEQEEEHQESKARRQWKDEEHPLAGSTLVNGVPMSASRDLEIGVTDEQSFKEIIIDVEDNLSLIPSPDLVEEVEADPRPRCCSCFCFPCFPL